MAIRLRINGIPVKCDTAEEAAALLGAATPSKAGTPGVAASGKSGVLRPAAGAGNEFAIVWHLATDEGKGLLRLAAGRPGDVFVSELPEKLGVEENRSNWVRRKLAEAVAKKGVNLDAYLPQARTIVAGKAKTTYRATAKLRQAIQSLNEST